jgi:quercetin dioxygenase-like cupin family protein
MILKHSLQEQIIKLDKEGFSDVKARFLLTATEGCQNYALRLIEIGLGGYTSYHCHKEEHEMFIIQGQGMVISENENKTIVSNGDALFIASREYHQIKNTGNTPLKLICTIPILTGKTGRSTTPCE